MAELGKIEKPGAAAFSSKRKLYCVPALYPIPEADAAFRELFERYWSEVAQQLGRLEAAGKIGKVFCEHITASGEDALTFLSGIHETVRSIIKEKMEAGAEILSIERDDLLGPFLDWINCLRTVRTQEVFSRVFELFADSAEKRRSHLLKSIDSSLGQGEAGLLIMSDDERVRLPFPPDIEVFLVTPPSYDDILRWFRQKAKDADE